MYISLIINPAKKGKIWFKHSPKVLALKKREGYPETPDIPQKITKIQSRQTRTIVHLYLYPFTLHEIPADVELPFRTSQLTTIDDLLWFILVFRPTRSEHGDIRNGAGSNNA